MAPPPCEDSMTTETVDTRFDGLDGWSTLPAVEAMWDGQMSAVAAVRPALPAIAAAIEAAAAVLGDAGRLVYAGAGTSGRIGVQDGAELPPTFSWPRERVVFAMAGGMSALVESIEGAEDDANAGEAAMAAAKIGTNDVVIGIAASGTTLFTIAAIAAARQAGAVTIAIASNAGAPLLTAAAHKILVETGPEVLAGSTRMKAGTAHKVVLNLISTGIMIRLGRIYRGMMVEMRPTNVKLQRRAVAMVQRIVSCEAADAEVALAASGGDIKIAALVALGQTPADAAALLAHHAGNLRAAIARARPA